jgi:hypothetical protein
MQQQLSVTAVSLKKLKAVVLIIDKLPTAAQQQLTVTAVPQKT